METRLSEGQIRTYLEHLKLEEKSGATIEKYARDLRCFTAFAGKRVLEKSLIMEYKDWLREHYAVTSANSMLAAVNGFLRFAGLAGSCVRQFKIQRETFRPGEKELTKQEYMRLVNTARNQKSLRLSLILQTICATGIRVSELKYITVEAARQGQVQVSCKGKNRTVFLPPKLRNMLRQYAREKGITEGVLFLSRTGRPVSRHTVWKEMKELCERAGVEQGKVFPHNLRRLFARTFYGIEKDIAKLADLLGHSSIDTTRIYIMSTGAEHRRKVERMQLVL